MQVVCDKQVCTVPYSSSDDEAADEVHRDQYNSFGTPVRDPFTERLFSSSDDIGDCTLLVPDSQSDGDLSDWID